MQSSLGLTDVLLEQYLPVEDKQLNIYDNNQDIKSNANGILLLTSLIIINTFLQPGYSHIFVIPRTHLKCAGL